MAILATTAPRAAAADGFLSVLGGSGQEYATAVTSDSAGNTYVAGLTYSPDFPVTPAAFQTKFGGNSDAFVAKYGPDGKLLWCTYLGGILDDWATGVAVDSGGNVIVTGWTGSADFPRVQPAQSTLNNGASRTAFDAFVSKLDPTGSKLLYSTLLGGPDNDGANGLALDAAGNAYITGQVGTATGFTGFKSSASGHGSFVAKFDRLGALVYSFFHLAGTTNAIAVDASGSAYVAGQDFAVNPSTATKSFGPAGTSEAAVFKISPDGSQKIYETTLGGSGTAAGWAIALDSAGSVYVGGTTSSADFPLMNPLQTSPGARPLWKSTDGGSTWTPRDDLPFAVPNVLLADPTNASTLYMATGDLGIFKSIDGGTTWNPASSGIPVPDVAALAIDPVHPQTLYAAASTIVGNSAMTVYKTVNGGNSWNLIDSPPSSVGQLAVDAQNPQIVWELINGALRKSTDGGLTWNTIAFPGSPASFVLDPRVSGNVIATSAPFFGSGFSGGGFPTSYYRSTDGGATWTQHGLALVTPALAIDGSTNPSTVYNGAGAKSVDGGITWTAITPPPGGFPTSGPLTVDSAGTIYAAVSEVGLFVSRDHAQTWTALHSFIPPTQSPAIFQPEIASIVPAGTSGALYAVTNQMGSSGFVTKLSADGSTIAYSTYLRGHASMEAFEAFAAEPNMLLSQNWVSALAVDASGNLTAAGGTRSIDFPTVNALQRASAGLSDAFAATLSADGGKLTYATYLGGPQDDGALAVALGPQGEIVIAGQTFSGDFRNPGSLQAPAFSYGDAFVAKLVPPASPVISSVLNGASFQPGIEAGSWVMIKGTNLANTNPGRTWTASEVVNGNLPTALDGVSVTMDGKPAFVYYISPTQINVQAPSDTTLGAVNVVVNNNGALSSPFSVALQAAAPAFFMYTGTNSVIASRLPDYTLIGDPATVPGPVAAKPGDILTLWGTGFGATNPAVPAGSAVTGVPEAVVTPAVTVGGVQVQVISSILTADSAGLYQVTIQLPADLPSGTLPIQAAVGNISTQTSVFLTIAR